jgi:hypothetical protein
MSRRGIEDVESGTQRVSIESSLLHVCVTIVESSYIKEDAERLFTDVEWI